MRLRLGALMVLMAGSLAAGACGNDDVEVVRVIMWTDYVDAPGATQGTEIWMAVDGDGPVWNAGMTFDADGNLTNASSSGPEHDNYYAPADGTARCDEVDGTELPEGFELPEGEWWRFWEISNEFLEDDGFERASARPALPAPPIDAEPDARASRSAVPDDESAAAWVKDGVLDTNMTPGLRYYLVDPEGYQVAGVTTALDGERAFSHQLLLVEFFAEDEGNEAMAERFRWDEWCA